MHANGRGTTTTSSGGGEEEDGRMGEDEIDPASRRNCDGRLILPGVNESKKRWQVRGIWNKEASC